MIMFNYYKYIIGHCTFYINEKFNMFNNEIL